MKTRDFSETIILLTDLEQTDMLRHFSHFMIAYFVDVVLWCHDNPGRHVIVHECGPCTAWFDLLEPGVKVTIVTPTEARKLAEKFPDRVVVSRGRFEFATRSVGDKLRRFRNVLVGQRERRARNGRVFALRATAPEFYQPGSWMRSISNEAELAGFLSRFFKIASVEFLETTPREAIDIMSSSRLLVAQRGAALMNLVFMPPGSTVVEIYPRDFQAKGRRIELYRRTCAALGLRFVRVYQRSKFSSVSPLRLGLVLLWVQLTSPFARPARWPKDA
jgi:hypothetical protein